MKQFLVKTHLTYEDCYLRITLLPDDTGIGIGIRVDQYVVTPSYDNKLVSEVKFREEQPILIDITDNDRLKEMFNKAIPRHHYEEDNNLKI